MFGAKAAFAALSFSGALLIGGASLNGGTLDFRGSVALAQQSSKPDQQPMNADYSGKGKNIAFMLVDASPEFFRNNYEVLRKRYPELYVRRVITDDGDDYLMVAMLTNGDVIEFLGEIIYEIDKLDGVQGSHTWLGNVTHAARPLTIEQSPRTGFIVAQSNPKLSKEERVASLTSISESLSAMPEVLMVAESHRDGNLVILYDLATTDIAKHNTFLSNVDDLFGDKLLVGKSGECPPVMKGD